VGGAQRQLAQALQFIAKKKRTEIRAF